MKEIKANRSILVLAMLVVIAGLSLIVAVLFLTASRAKARASTAEVLKQLDSSNQLANIHYETELLDEWPQPRKRFVKFQSLRPLPESLLNPLLEIRSLTHLCLTDQVLDTDSAESISRMSGLHTLELLRCELVGDWSAVSKLERLHTLRLSSSEVEFENVIAFAKTASITNFAMAYSQLSSTQLNDTLQLLPRLQIVDLTESYCDDQCVGTLAALDHLVEAGLSSTEITDSGLKSLSESRSLKRLWIAETAVTDNGLHDLLSLKSLREVSAFGCERVSAKACSSLVGVTVIGIE